MGRTDHAEPEADRSRRLELFDRATQRQLERQQTQPSTRPPDDRGWRREELYDRGVAG